MNKRHLNVTVTIKKTIPDESSLHKPLKDGHLVNRALWFHDTTKVKKVPPLTSHFCGIKDEIGIADGEKCIVRHSQENGARLSEEGIDCREKNLPELAA